MGCNINHQKIVCMADMTSLLMKQKQKRVRYTTYQKKLKDFGLNEQRSIMCQGKISRPTRLLIFLENKRNKNLRYILKYKPINKLKKNKHENKLFFFIYFLNFFLTLNEMIKIKAEKRD
jgi:hypothetical protein